MSEREDDLRREEERWGQRREAEEMGMSAAPESEVVERDVSRSRDRYSRGDGEARDRTLVTPPPSHAEETFDALFSDEESSGFRTRWEQVQSTFVDEPRQAVERADQLVKEVTTRLEDVFTHERKQLEDQWSADDDVSTEDLRLALRRYRSFFDRLLSM